MKNNMVIVILIGVILVAAGAYYWTTIQGPSNIQIQQKGSDTLLVLAQNWAEAYTSDHSNVDIVVSGGGSGTGISALVNKQIDIADASRQIKQKELDAANEAGVDPIEWKVALDGISIIVNQANNIDELTYNQIRGLYNGSTTDWLELGGTDGTVVAYGRQSTSGTYVYFNEEVMEEDDYRADMNQMSGNADIVEAVINDPNGIGYVGVAYAEARKEELKVVRVKLDESSEPYLPTVSDIANGNYPVSRYLYVYTDGIPEEAVSDYIKFMLSSEGQDIVEDIGYIALPGELRTEQLNMLR
jgi:phosphate transport system substrate-binding protein